MTPSSHRKHFSRAWLLAPATIVALGLIAAGIFAVLNRTNGSILSGGERRSYLVHVPPSYTPGTPVPLVISMHGFAGWPARQAESTHWNQLADEEGFIVVYPAGTSFPMRWSSHQLPGAADVSMKDVVFISD
ncbi:MAG TPA: PHB depolymerase family esterase, partial [Anaerolineaceae bacterium]|nr:PHB depolymerase family esterase [Anaerolineaceae bacterium]